MIILRNKLYYFFTFAVKIQIKRKGYVFMKKLLAAALTAAMLVGSAGTALANSTSTSFDVGDDIAGAVTSDGTLMMWGKNEYGEFGNGTTSIPEYGTTVEFEKTAEDIKQIAFGTYSSSYMLKTDGTLYGSGKNYGYALGDGTNEDKTTPVKIMEDVVLVGAGSEYALALKSDGTLWGWGDPVFFGQETNGIIKTPVKIYDNVRYFSCGAQHCALITSDDKLYTAGNGSHGENGTGTDSGIYEVGFTYVMDNVKTVSCGAYNTLVVDNNGALWSCGSNTYGQLLGGATGDNALSLQKVIDSGIKSAAVYKDDSIYITENGELYAAGDNLWGQFGLGWDKTPYEDAGKIYKIADNVTDAAIGWQNVLYRTSDGTLYMTGSNVGNGYNMAFYGTKPMLENVAQNFEPQITAAKAENKIVLQIGSDKLSNNGVQTTLDVPAQTINDRTMVPLRAIFEALGASVDWDDATQTVTSVRGDITVTLEINSDTLYKNGEGKTLDVPAQLVDERTLVPVRAVAEAFDARVEWDEETQTVTITD